MRIKLSDLYITVRRLNRSTLGMGMDQTFDIEHGRGAKYWLTVATIECTRRPASSIMTLRELDCFLAGMLKAVEDMERPAKTAPMTSEGIASALDALDPDDAMWVAFDWLRRKNHAVCLFTPEEVNKSTMQAKHIIDAMCEGGSDAIRYSLKDESDGIDDDDNDDDQDEEATS